MAEVATLSNRAAYAILGRCSHRRIDRVPRSIPKAFDRTPDAPALKISNSLASLEFYHICLLSSAWGSGIAKSEKPGGDDGQVTASVAIQKQVLTSRETAVSADFV